MITGTMCAFYASSIRTIGTSRHGQEGALAPLWKCCKVFFRALVVTAKRPVEEFYVCIIFTTCR